ncbi:MAG TPA: hypothetical protein GXX40_01215 [Firmicutes bacterium]|nr:hypothetical protein [Bacillota bacterium]
MELPEGVQDLWPPVPAIQRELENRLIKLLTRAGFVEVRTPTFELYENLRRGGQSEESLYKLIDTRGRVLALRPDFTLPVMRMALSRVETGELPWKVCYAGQVFRLRPMGSGRPHEYTQVGAEIIGTTSGDADGEILRLAAEGLLAAGCRQFRIVVGDCLVTSRLLQIAQMEEGQRKAARRALLRRDMVELERCIGGPVLECFTVRGRQLEVARMLLGKAGPDEAVSALDRLERLVNSLNETGPGIQAEVDLGLVRDLNYYTGMVFEVYADSSAVSLGGGGRYDKLGASFGREIGAVGFALDLSELARVHAAWVESDLSLASIH